MPGGKLLIVGNRLVRLNHDGSLDATFGDGGSAGLIDGTNAIVYGWSVQDDGSIEYGTDMQATAGAIHPRGRAVLRPADQRERPGALKRAAPPHLTAAAAVRA